MKSTYKVIDGPLKDKNLYIKRLKINQTIDIHTWEGSTTEDHQILRYKRVWWKKLKFEKVICEN